MNDRLGLNKNPKSGAVTAHPKNKQPRQKKLSQPTSSKVQKAPKTAVRKMSEREEFKRPREKLEAVDHETEIMRQRELRRQLDQKLMEIEMKSKIRHDIFEKEKADLQQRRNQMLARHPPTQDKLDESQNDRSRRRKWNKGTVVNDISIVSSDEPPHE